MLHFSVMDLILLLVAERVDLEQQYETIDNI